MDFLIGFVGIRLVHAHFGAQLAMLVIVYVEVLAKTREIPAKGCVRSVLQGVSTTSKLTDPDFILR